MPKPIATEIELKTEAKQLNELIVSLWDNTESLDLKSFVIEAFEAGLVAGRFWVEEYPLFTIGEFLDGETAHHPLSNRRNPVKGDDCAHHYDSLYILSEFIERMISDIRESQIHYGAWDFSAEADRLYSVLSDKYPLDSLKPKSLTREQTDSLVNNYQGFSESECRSYSTPEKLAPHNINDAKNSQGLDFARSLVATIFSHGLGCAQQINTARLLNTLLPLYRDHRDTPYEFDNGPELLSLIADNELIQIALMIEKPKFSSQQAFDDNIKRIEENKAKIAAETPEEKQARIAEHKKWHKEMMQEVLGGDFDSQLAEHQNRIRSIIDDYRLTASTYLASY